jgi:DNA-binding response OmpR family regulator
MTFILNKKPLDLTPAQFRLLHYLYQHAGEVCTRETCAQAIWGRDYDPGLDADALDRAMSNLRGQLRQVDPDSDLIETRRGLGYLLHP